MADPALDMIIRHRVGLEQYTNTINNRIRRHLQRVQKDIVDQINQRGPFIDERGVITKQKNRRRLTRMNKVIEDLLAEAHIALRKDQRDGLVDLAEYEAEFVEQLYTNGLGINSAFDRPSRELLRAIVTSEPFRGDVLRSWAQQMEANQLRRIKQQIQIGLTEGESIEEIVQRLRGTRALNFTDGQFAKDKRNAEALTRTAVNHVQSRAHEEVVKHNPKLFSKKYEWVSVLDSRTTPICQSRAGRIYNQGEGPLPPGHWGCRSVVRYFTKFEDVPESQPKYDEWLRDQPAAVQDEVLGKKKGRLYREGRLNLSQFINDGRMLTLEQLREREAKAWQALSRQNAG
ncbi:minor capsid protein [Dichotomicrobium thermohalophilum]|uniref:SPP1 gp7 family putative phage head morphogenesis protein n=1 Tax=Dichotomicrobium thermohalophilum TaxID=933063 RepID=A0A397PED3_9HYPH|nr:minor capsid protein [Dichotomicrobium thermohalophilum]RIA47318.1 SPP1 gp7 family putative phage head morphogenesis protein [Dichotomicrobium thermohalophilum]